jgi:hypothetical protein
MMFSRASHEWDWPLHIKTAKAMLSYMFAAHKYSNGRYGLYYVCSMTCLGPEILDKFCRLEQLLNHTTLLFSAMDSGGYIYRDTPEETTCPGGIIEITESPQTMTTLVCGMDVTMTLTGNTTKMPEDEENASITHM